MTNLVAIRRPQVLRRFTLVEILFVILIISLLVGLLLPVVTRGRNKSRYARWEATLKSTINDERLLVMYDFQDLQDNPGVLKNRSVGLSVDNYEQSRYDMDYVNCKVTQGRWPTKGALQFDGTAYLENADLYGVPQLHEEFSVIVWVKFDSLASTQNLCTISTGTDYAWQLGVRNGRLTAWRRGGTPLAQENADLQVDTWYQVAYVYRDETHWLYRDGVLVATGKGWPDWGSADTLNIGRWAAGSEYLRATMDEFLYYKGPLTDDEVYDNYRMGQL